MKVMPERVNLIVDTALPVQCKLDSTSVMWGSELYVKLLVSVLEYGSSAVVLEQTFVVLRLKVRNIFCGKIP
jgi:hypothetical protein